MVRAQTDMHKGYTQGQATLYLEMSISLGTYGVLAPCGVKESLGKRPRFSVWVLQERS